MPTAKKKTVKKSSKAKKSKAVRKVQPKHKVKPTLAVWKFASCDGCQLSLLSCEDELLDVVGGIELAYFLEATSAMIDGPYDVSLVEGSITTEFDAKRILKIREQSKILITIGACATAGGIQGLKNFANVNDYIKAVYARPEYISTLKTSMPIKDYVDVDFELRGCPIDKGQLLEVINATLNGRVPAIPHYSQCVECKKNGTVCVMVAKGTPCLGPVTQAGCGNLCPSTDRGCYGCFGPSELPNGFSLAKQFEKLGMNKKEIRDFFRSYNASAGGFREISEAYDLKK
ncbi:MAG TPA: oxidoreductase [Rhodospirillaceae bacterium]|nr:oxidoreductase [Rhodospirillaceae bacterium]